MLHLLTPFQNLFINNGNTDGIYLDSGDTHIILNSIFLNNGSYDVTGGENVVVSMTNNYIDE